MSPKMPRISGDEAARALEKLGFERVRQKGSHLILKKKTDEGEIGCVVPMHRELADKTLRNILKQAGLSYDEFMEQL